jgi:phage tail-like protein
MKVGRRSFLGTMAASAAALKFAERAAEAAAARPYTAGRFALELDGAVAGWLQSVKGGDARADVVVEALGGIGSYPKKHLAQLSYADIEMSLSLPASGSLAEWIEATLAGSLDRRDGAIVAVDAQSKEMWRREFSSALITEIQFPALDGASKDPAFLTVKIQPEYTNRAKGSGAILGSKTASKSWLRSNFRLSLGNLDCSRVTKIDSLTVKRQMQEEEIGVARGYAKIPGNFEVSDLVVTLPEAYAQDFVDWHEDFLIQGNCADGDELKGEIELLAPNATDVLGTIELANVGIFALSDEATSANADSIRRIKAEMYVEKVSFELKTLTV